MLNNTYEHFQIIANIWYIHHDPKIWGDPWNFRPERFLNEDGQLLPREHIYRRKYLFYCLYKPTYVDSHRRHVIFLKKKKTTFFSFTMIYGRQAECSIIILTFPLLFI